MTQFSYDANGNLPTMIDANGHVMSYEYDALNRRTKNIYGDSTFDQTAYDALGRVISKSDQAGSLTQYSHDALGRLIRVTDALNQITQYGYDELGNQITQTDANGRITKFEYDKLGRRTKRTLPLNQVEIHTYNAAGNLLTRKDFNNKSTTYSYDSMNRLLSKTPDASFAAPAVTFTYTPTGRRLTMTDAHGVTSYGYDSRDRLLSKATPEGTLSYTYDNSSNVLSLRSSSTNGVSGDYAYDPLNRLSTVTDNASAARPASGTTTYRYDDVGNIAGFLYPNGVDTSYQYNALNRSTSTSITGASSLLASFIYELAPVGNRLSVIQLSGRKASYTYDDLYRLKSETITSDSVTVNNGTITYIYDAVGNRLNRTSTIAAIPTTSSTLNANDQLNVETYDASGNTTASGGKTYVYDFENRIKSVNSGQITFVYDGDGNRVAKTVSGVTTKYLVDTNSPTGYAQVVEETVGSGIQRVYVHGHSIISQTQFIAGNWLTSFYGYDGHGSVHLLTDTGGEITDSYTYDAFGNLVAQTGTTPNSYLFAGEQLDSALGLYYLRARYMNPDSGRFWNLDRFAGSRFDPLSLHKYLYAASNPVDNVDPSGNFTITQNGAYFLMAATLLTMAVVYHVALREKVKDALEDITFTIPGPVQPTPDRDQEPEEKPGPPKPPTERVPDLRDDPRFAVNLDTNTALAIISEGSSEKQRILTYIAGRRMVMCTTALAEFQNIANGYGGPFEKARALRFLNVIYPENDNPSLRAKRLRVTNRVGASDIIIFGTGDSLGLTTTTADRNFVSGANSQGVSFKVWFHYGVPLTGQ